MRSHGIIISNHYLNESMYSDSGDEFMVVVMMIATTTAAAAAATAVRLQLYT